MSNTLQNYIAACEARGDKPKKVHAVITTHMPIDHVNVMFWSLSKRDAKGWMRNRIFPGYRLVKLEF